MAVRPRIVVGHLGGRCELVVPLGITGRGSRSVLRWLAGDASDYNAPLASPELKAGFRPDDAAAFWRSVVDLAGPAAVLDLGRQPERIGSANPFIAEGAGEEACRAHSLRLAAAAAAGPPKRCRKRLRALERDHGKASFVILPPGEDCALAVARIIGWKRAQLAASGGFSPFEAEGERAFLPLPPAIPPCRSVSRCSGRTRRCSPASS